VHRLRFQISSVSLGSLSVIWVISIVWLVGITPIVCTAPSVAIPIQSSIPSGIPDIHEPRMSVAPLADSELLMRGINMAWYTNTKTVQFTLEDEKVVDEDITPYWFRIGFNLDILRADLDALQIMGVRHIRVSALIFQFLNWHDDAGSMGLNASVIANFNYFLEEVQNRGMILTVSLLGPLWSYSEHPSLMRYFRLFNETTGMNPTALFNLGQAILGFAEYYRTNEAIHTWELVSSFSRFTECLSDSTTGFGLVIDSTLLFDFLESVAEGIRTVDDEHFVTVSDGWPLDYDEDWWATGLVPIDYDERLQDVTDYIAICQYSDNATLNPAGSLNRPSLIVEIASSQLYNHSREVNSEVLLKTYAAAINQSYSGFCPWEFSQNLVVHEENTSISNHQRHDWTWDALLLFSLYRIDSVKFINTTNWYVLSTEPQFDQSGLVSFTLFHRPESVYPVPFGFEDERSYDPADGGTIVTVLSRNLLVGDALVINRQAMSGKPLYNLEELGICEYANTLVTIYDIGHVEETGIRLESNSTWEAVVDIYDSFQIVMEINTTGPAGIEVESGNFVLIEGNDYTVSYTDTISGVTWEKIVEADENLTIRVSLNASSLTIRITPSFDVLGMLSLGMSVSVIIISIVVFYYVDRRTPKVSSHP